MGSLLKTEQIGVRAMFGQVITGTLSFTFQELDITVASDSVAETAHGLITGNRVQIALVGTASDTFVDGDVTVGTDNINIATHGWITGQRVQMTTTGTLPAGLALATDYYIIKVDADNIKVASSYANAIAGTPVDITAAAGGGTHTITTEYPDGLAASTDYWIIKVDADNFKLASSLANANAGTAVTITGGDGSSSFTLTATDKLEGPDKHQIDLEVQSTGVYKLTPKKAFENAFPIVLITPITTGMIFELSSQAVGSVTVTIKDADTPAATDASFAFMIVGMDVEDPY